MRQLNALDAVNQTRPIDGVSDKYGFASSRDIISTFEAKGWQVESVQNAHVKKIEKAGFQKHLVWLKNDKFGPISGLSKNNESLPRLCLVNSHDTSSSLNIMLGVMRTACLNQLITGSVFRFFRAVHSQSIISKLSNGIDYMSEGIPELIENIQRLQGYTLDLSKRREFARKCIEARFANVKNVVAIDFDRALSALRAEDCALDAYTVLNVVQEKVIRGGVNYTYLQDVKNASGEVVDKRLIATRTRAIGSIASSVRLNGLITKNMLELVA